jgi:hypothetical protein
VSEFTLPAALAVAKALGIAFAKHSFLAGQHYCAADLRAGLLTAGVDAVCEGRGRKAGHEKASDMTTNKKSTSRNLLLLVTLMVGS